MTLTSFRDLKLANLSLTKTFSSTACLTRTLSIPAPVNYFLFFGKKRKHSTDNKVLPVQKASCCMDLPVRDGQSSIHSSFKSSEHLIPCGGPSEASVQIAGKSTWLTINAFHIELLPSHFKQAFIHLIQTKLVQELNIKFKKSWYSALAMDLFTCAHMKCTHFSSRMNVA